ncbi:CcoQ/FixQ family Cbb3-type cytochrome c oxidase assembly chaperone [Panacibacter sp. DH6]|uniref:CcoQ/FixQ family Cbb3-type cytochrome c oxidase assembly chaperone n=1 Tax=Panacibacter microcysteis TaxID=2793269 RepID=A0A931GZD8_9BACT|nr:CcoQ/FixQ family Cbb3-type cytochrome c oxidase assembly chaperone [Panacibacter microcysteis]MBG9378123.1 CcoQ/FixQ family Cbb3-type cytochrome c oxidase assembly chaperone [Panacibacter microcysteis]
MNFLNYLEKITGVDVFGLTSFMIFFVFFVVMSLWAWRADRKLIDVMKQIPLDKTEINN